MNRNRMELLIGKNYNLCRLILKIKNESHSKWVQQVLFQSGFYWDEERGCDPINLDKKYLFISIMYTPFAGAINSKRFGKIGCIEEDPINEKFCEILRIEGFKPYDFDHGFFIYENVKEFLIRSMPEKMAPINYC